MTAHAMANEIKHEASGTYKILERIPVDQWDWKPHDKSTAIGQLALHVAQLPGWASRILSSADFDIAAMKRDLPLIQNTQDLVAFAQSFVQRAVADLQKSSDEDLFALWTLRRGEQVVFNLPKAVAIRSMAMNHLIHHRGQLSVYLRLLNIPVPGLYGPSADERL